MCLGALGIGGGSGGANNAAKEMEAEEQLRQSNILQGKSQIDEIFGDKFTDDYWGDFLSSYLGYYMPQLDKNYADSQGSLTAALAGRGMLESTVGADATADLTQAYNDQQALTANQAQDQVQSLQSQAAQAKGDLYALNQSAADPNMIAAQALGASSAISAPTSFSPLGNVFAGFLQPYTNYQNASSNASGPAYRSPVGMGTAPLSSSGSATLY